MGAAVMAAVLLGAAALLPALWLERLTPTGLWRLRQAWFRGLALCGLVWAATWEPWLAVIGFGAWLWWAEGALVTWLAVGATWALAQQLPDWAWGVLPHIWGVWVQAATLALIYQWRRDPARIRGWWATRSLAGAFLALLLPVCPLWAWPGGLVGLWFSGPSWLAVLATLAGAWVRWPHLSLLWAGLLAMGIAAGFVVAAGVPVKGRRIGEWTPRGDSLDSLRQRWRLWRLSLATFRWRGIGPGRTLLQHQRWGVRGLVPEVTGHAHNEPLELLHEYGLVGAVALGLFAARVAGALTGGDPWSGAVVAGAVLAGGTMALRVAPLGLLWLLACAQVTR